MWPEKHKHIFCRETLKITSNDLIYQSLVMVLLLKPMINLRIKCEMQFSSIDLFYHAFYFIESWSWLGWLDERSLIERAGTEQKGNTKVSILIS